MRRRRPRKPVKTLMCRDRHLWLSTACVLELDHRGPHWGPEPDGDRFCEWSRSTLILDDPVATSATLKDEREET